MNRGNGKFIRLRSPENIIEEINYRQERCKRAVRICFNDEVFGVIDEWVDDFSAKYKAACTLPFECELVPKLIKERNVQRLSDAGMFSLHFGIQSGHDEIRKEVMHRPGTNAELVEKAELLSRYGVETQFDIILDNPFDHAEALETAVDFLLKMPRPINLNTYKMQYFPHYPFTEMALKAGHVKPEQVTYEAVAQSVLYNMVYRPKFPAFNRRDYLENCIYLLSFNSAAADRLVRSLRARHNVVLAVVVTLLAQIRYRYAFERRMGLVWMRRIYLGVKMMLSGELGGLLRKALAVLQGPRVSTARTGRISTR
jgi:anaerobic magnesium-protoporphyrin IX monomethyl ester cyclase